MGSDNYQEFAKVRSVFSALNQSTVTYNSNTGFVASNVQGDPINGIYTSQSQGITQLTSHPPTLNVYTTIDANSNLTIYNSASQGKPFKLVFTEFSNTDGNIYEYTGDGNIGIKEPGLYAVGGYISNVLVGDGGRFGNVDSIRMFFSQTNFPNTQISYAKKRVDYLYFYQLVTIPTTDETYSFWFTNDPESVSPDITVTIRNSPDALPFRGFGGFLIKLGSVIP